jgi:hypothetical protein
VQSPAAMSSEPLSAPGGALGVIFFFLISQIA